MTNFCQPSDTYLLKRPSGLCFDAAGRLYVTSMTGQVMVLQHNSFDHAAKLSMHLAHGSCSKHVLSWSDFP